MFYETGAVKIDIAGVASKWGGRKGGRLAKDAKCKDPRVRGGWSLLGEIVVRNAGSDLGEGLSKKRGKGGSSDLTVGGVLYKHYNWWSR